MRRLYTISAGWVHTFYRALVGWGVTEEEIFRASGLKRAHLLNPDDRIPVEQYVKLGNMAPKLTNTPEIGLVLGQRSSFEDMGIVFLLGMNCPTVRDSLVHTKQYSNLGNEAVKEGFEEGDELAEWSEQCVSFSYMSSTLVEFSCVQKLRIFRTVVGEDFRPVQFKFQCSDPPYIDKYREVFQAPLLFDQEKSSLVFKKAYLDFPNPNPHPYLRDVLSARIRILNKELEENRLFKDRVRNIIIQHLHTGTVTREAVAGLLNVSSQTAYRKLKEENVSYTTLLDETQKQLAQEYLKEASVPINEISFLLGFSEASAFHRAFKRWFGKTPGQYRSLVGPLT